MATSDPDLSQILQLLGCSNFHGIRGCKLVASAKLRSEVVTWFIEREQNIQTD